MRLQNALLSSQSRLTQAGIDNASLDTRLLIAHALGCDRAALLTQSERTLTADEQKKIEALIARRGQREPVARILGLREFWGLPFGLNEATLEPRPDSETLIEAALEKTKATGAPHAILDLGTGTGCLLLALLHEWPHATGLGIDKAPRAVEQATLNAQRLGLEAHATFQGGDWLSGITQRFDMIVSNPPYIPSADIAALSPEVRDFDPLVALDGGADGLGPYRLLIPQLAAHLTPSGLVFFEVGIGQADDVAALLHAHGFTEVESVKDLGGIARVVCGRAPALL